MKIKTILVILLAGTLLASCHGDLNIIQKSEVSANSMWQDEGDATSAMYGMFNKFRATFSTGYIYWGEYRTGLWADGLAGQTARDQVYQNQIPTNHGYANWADLYTTINNANLILKYTPDIAFNSEDAKNKILANASARRTFSDASTSRRCIQTGRRRHRQCFNFDAYICSRQESGIIGSH